MIAQEIAHPGRINAEHQDHRGILKALKGDVIAGTNLHVTSPGGLANLNRDQISAKRGVRSR
jgi:hypothetical protein